MDADHILSATDEQLKYALEAALNWRDIHKQRVQEFRKKADDIQAELDRRALAAYWQAHPELVRLEVGDKLLVTQEFIDHKQKVVRQGSSYELGEAYEIQYFDTQDVFCYIHSGAYVTGCPLAIASNMRRAYLEQQEEMK